jgi:hypothetical protein
VNRFRWEILPRPEQTLASACSSATAASSIRFRQVGRGSTLGYMASYDLLDAIDAVVILAVRHQREAGFD